MTEEYEIQRSPAWHEFRKNHIGSSEASVCMNCNPWKTQLELYNEKVNCNSPSNTDNYAMRRGMELEPLALAKFESETGYLMTPRVLTSLSNKYNFMSASLDGYEIEGKCAVEIKCPGKSDHALALKGDVPEKYMPQLHHIMLVADLDWIYYMSYVSDDDFIIFKVYKDNDYADKLLDAEYEFWHRNIQDRNPPEPTDRDTQEIKDPNWVHYCDKYREISVEKKDLQNRLNAIKLAEESIKNELILLANNKSAIGAGLTLTKCVPRKLYDYEKMIEDKLGKDFDKTPYLKPSTESWRISFQGEKE